jgi:fatty acid desaturase
MKYSRYDYILVSLLMVQILVMLVPYFWQLSLPYLGLLILVNIILMGTNYQCIAHNFIHLPFFKSKVLNNVFSVINTLGLGVPQSIYRLHHLNHHRHNNHPDGDMSSTYRFGKNGKEENILTYSLLGIVRTDLTGLYQKASRSSSLPLWETLFLLAFLSGLAAVNWKLFLFYILPSYLGGQFFALWENYCEHHHALPQDRQRDSVSCYNPVYNYLWFNNGYHQEHHFSPQVHWRNIPKVRPELPPDRVIVKGCHLFNSL